VLVDSESTLTKIAQQKFDKEGGAKLRYHIAKLIRLVSAETKHFHEERNALIEKYGSGEPKTISAATPEFKIFIAAVKELTAVPITIAWGPLTDVMLEPYAEITAADLFTLGPLFTFVEQPADEVAGRN
jgi:hypothetical protein